MIGIYKNHIKSDYKIIKLKKQIFKIKKLGIYNSKKNIFYIIYYNISKYIKLGNKINKNLLHLILKDLKI
uniref:Uncharacterized protein n=1 Tax=Nephromyces sp. ex Molgula occidentalis TaxID=2544991 RepID=A0A5C1HAN5_9APIC|nr:hypothetical protein [Nephromyces sp. ex Molgula occidentalis]